MSDPDGRDCPNCTNCGFYPDPVPDDDGLDLIQCEWCYTVEDSKFNVAARKASSTEARNEK